MPRATTCALTTALATTLAAALSVFLIAVPATPAAPASAAAAGGDAVRPVVKPLLTGLLNRNGPPSAELSDVVDSYVVQVNWAKIQPRRKAFRPAAIDRAFAQAQRSGARVKLRVLTGVHAPRWAKRLGGAPVRLRDPHDSQAGSVPRFWSRAYGRAYAGLQRRLAQRYDDRAVLAEVVISRCSTFYAEPFIRQTSDAGSRRALLRAGYTAAKDKRCHRQQVVAHRAWKQTRSGLALNPTQLVTRTGGRRVDTGFTIAMMRHCKQSLAARCVLGNNSIRSPITSLDAASPKKHYQRMYTAIARYAPTLAFQTATAERMGSCVKTLDWAAKRGASYVEIPWNAHAAGCTGPELRSASRSLG
ncbi:MAG: hypothetical protein WBP61_07290 [Nocardioides sp.]